MERGGEVESGFVERQTMPGSPEIQDVAMSAAVGVKTLKDALAQMGRERGRPVGRLGVQRARPAPLQATTAQLVEQAEMTQYLFERDLLAQEGVVDAWPKSKGDAARFAKP